MSALSLRSRLMIIFIVLSVITMLVSGMFLLSNARSAIQNEVAASKILANSLIKESLKTIPNFITFQQFLETLPVKFKEIRHIRIRVYNEKDRQVFTNPAYIVTKNEIQKEPTEESPLWFRSLLWPHQETTKTPIRFGSQELGYVTLTVEPLDEMNEIWADIVILMKIAAISLLVLLTSIHVALGRALKPIGSITEGMKNLEAGNFKYRISKISSPELSIIGQGFNDLARKLDIVSKKSEKLSQRIVTVQDQERRHIAQELHDEFGPCLFGIKSNATSVRNHLQAQEEVANDAFKEKMQSVLDIVSHMEACNRDLLNKLRPMALGEIDLSELIEKLVGTFRARYNHISWKLEMPTPLPSFGETIDLTVYRFIQESLTNVARHSKAKNVMIDISQDHLIHIHDKEMGNNTELNMSVRDDGVGISDASKPGHGITGLEERIEALGGVFSISQNHPQGVKVEARIQFSQQD